MPPACGWVICQTMRSPTLPRAKSSSSCIDSPSQASAAASSEPYFFDEPAAELLPQPLQLRPLDALHRPEEQAVLVLDLDDGDGRVPGQGDAV